MIENKRICGLITDFGNKDYFIGVMRGVMKKINSDIEVIDITNEIPSYNLLPASFALQQAYCYFPEKTIFLVVVDPGVGTEREILLVEYDNRFFIGPDNGVLTPILKKEQKTVGILDNKKYFLIDGISTFEARDKMAPAAAYLSAGVHPREIAATTSDFIVNPDYFPSLKENAIDARIVYIDKFGNIMTNVAKEFLLEMMKENRFSDFKIILNNQEINKFYNTYGLADSKSEPFMLFGSHQNLEIAMNMNSASSRLNASIGQQLIIKFY